MTPADSTATKRDRLSRLGGWAGPLAVLFTIWLWLAFSSGGFTKNDWLLPGMLLGVFGIVIASVMPRLNRPRGFSFAVLGMSACYSLVVAFSVLWADSVSRVWMESSRTFGYLLAFALALIFLRDDSTRRSFRYLLMAAALVTLTICLVRLGSGGAEGIADLFIQRRFSFPVGHPNNAAVLFLVAFWPLVWLAAGPEERAPVRGLALGLATGLLALALLTQSRVAACALAVTLLVTFIVSPARLRTLLYLLVPALLMVYVFPHLNRYWLEGPEAVGGGLAVRTVALTATIACLLGLVLAMLERWIRVTRRMKLIFGTIVLLGSLGGLTWAAVTVDRDAEAQGSSLAQTLRQFIMQEPLQLEAGQTSSFHRLAADGREDIWRVATQEFRSAPFLGVGADNFVFRYDRLRAISGSSPKQAHSLELQVLGETGVVGGVFAFGGILMAAARILWPRSAAGWQMVRRARARRRERPATSGGPAVSDPSVDASPDDLPGESSSKYGWHMALLTACAYWLVHASIDWPWRMSGVTVPALLILAAGLSSFDTSANPLRLRLSPRRRTAQVRVDGQSRSSWLRSSVFRASLLTLSLLVFVFACLPYISSLYQDSALALADRDPADAAERAVNVHWLVPGDPEPFETQAYIYSGAAQKALVSDSPDRAGAVLDALALRLGSYEQAMNLEPADWSLQRAAGVAALDLYLARGYAEGWAPISDLDVVAAYPTGAHDWSLLSALRQDDPGAADDSLAQSDKARAEAERYRGLDREELARMALTYLLAAKQLNPLAKQIDMDLQVLAEVAPATAARER